MNPEPLKTYRDAEAFLMSLIDYERHPAGIGRQETLKDDIVRFSRLLEQAGSPHRRFAVIHVAGTKGKGSTCAFLESILRAGGLRVGLYTSPHLRTFLERIRGGGKMISGDDFARLLERLRQHMLKNSGDSQTFSYRTVFELLTAAAFLWFAEQEIDIAVVETGLGGRLDCTNVFDHPGVGPHVSVITPIGYDHVRILGDTIEQIAGEKAGIIHSHGAAVTAPQPPEWADRVEAVVEKRVEEVGAPKAFRARDLAHVEAVGEPTDGQVRLALGPVSAGGRGAHPLRSTLLDGVTVQCPLAGRHQLENLQTALAALLAFESEPGYSHWKRTHHWDGLDADALIRGIESIRWPGRFEIAKEDPVVVIDGAHCVLSIRALAETCRQRYPGWKWIAVIGFLKDKQVDQMCDALGGLFDFEEIITCRPPSPRGMAAGETAEAIARRLEYVRVTPVDDVARAVKTAVKAACASGDRIGVVAFGSLYSIAAIEDVLAH